MWVFFCIFIIIVQFSFRLWMLKAKPFTMFARNDLKPKQRWMNGTMDGLPVYFGALEHRARSFFGNCSAQQRGTRCMEQQRLNEWVLRPWPSRGSLRMALLMPFTYVHQLNFMTTLRTQHTHICEHLSQRSRFRLVADCAWGVIHTSWHTKCQIPAINHKDAYEIFQFS